MGMKRSIIRRLLAWLRDLLRPVVRVVRNRTIDRSSTTPTPDFDRLVEVMDNQVLDYLRDHPRCQMSYTLHLKGSGGAVEHEAGLVTCPSCGTRNRLHQGVEGSRCGSCHRSLSTAIN
jgi:hypothetical protein